MHWLTYIWIGIGFLIVISMFVISRKTLNDIQEINKEIEKLLTNEIQRRNEKV